MRPPSLLRDPRRSVAWLGVLLALLVLSLWLRLPDLDLKPLHSDEGVNGWFTLRLYWWNHYQYRPSDYHGPVLYYINAALFWLLGPSDVSLRLGTVLAGAAVPFALLPARRWLGLPGIALSGLLAAVAPCMVYFSRTCIHEMYLVLGSALWAACLARFAATPTRPWALGAAAGAFFAFGNKETALLTLGCLGVGACLAWLLGKQREGDLFGGRGRLPALRAWTLGAPRAWALGAALFTVLTVLFFSSFFTHWRGVPGFFEAYGPWIGYGTSGRNQGKPFGYFWELMAHSQGLAVWPAIGAATWALVARHRFGLALSGWAASAFLVYSAIPYKTPWCVLNIDLPVFLLVGWGANQAIEAARQRRHPALLGLATLAVVAALAPLPGLLAESRQVNAEGYDDDDHAYVYVQTTRGFYGLVRDMLGVAQASPRIDDVLGGEVLNIDVKNPTRWYLITRGWDHDRVRYTKKLPEQHRFDEADMVVVSGKLRAKVAQRVEKAGEWHKESYDLRPGWKVRAYFRQADWDAYEEAGGPEAHPFPRRSADSIHEPRPPRR